MRIVSRGRGAQGVNGTRRSGEVTIAMPLTQQRRRSLPRLLVQREQETTSHSYTANNAMGAVISYLQGQRTSPTMSTVTSHTAQSTPASTVCLPQSQALPIGPYHNNNVYTLYTMYRISTFTDYTLLTTYQRSLTTHYTPTPYNQRCT